VGRAAGRNVRAIHLQVVCPVVSDAEQDARSSVPSPSVGEPSPLDLTGWTPAMARQLKQLIISRRFASFADACCKVGNLRPADPATRVLDARRQDHRRSARDLL
jgi:hypothetical protein